MESQIFLPRIKRIRELMKNSNMKNNEKYP